MRMRGSADARGGKTSERQGQSGKIQCAHNAPTKLNKLPGPALSALNEVWRSTQFFEFVHKDQLRSYDCKGIYESSDDMMK
jgi:hypothetical protein